MRKLQQTEDQTHQINSQETECQSELKKDFEDSNDLKAMRREGEEISDAQLDEHLSLASSLQQNVAQIQKRINCSRANEETFEAPKGDITRKNKVFKQGKQIVIRSKEFHGDFSLIIALILRIWSVLCFSKTTRADCSREFFFIQTIVSL